jgi:Tfp pilus assembly protein PilN
MINLLPPNIRQDTLYARRNVVLLRWVIACGIALIGIGLIVGAGFVYLDQTSKSHAKRAEAARASLQAQKVEETGKKIEEISNNTKLATQVLSKEILFSKLLRQLGAALPANTTLTGLQIDKVQGGLALTASAKDVVSATQIQLNLEDPNNKIFEKADIESITCASSSDNPYPCVVQIRALFGKNNPYLYITPTVTGTEKKQ